MNPFLNGLLNLLTVGVSEIFTSQGSFKGAMNNFGEILSNWGKTANDVGHQNMLGNWIAKMTGSRLTDAELQANEWNEQQVLAAWQRQMEADNTKYQRQVADMQAAGLNPMLAAGGTLHAPTASVAQSVSPSAGAFGLDSILNLLKIRDELSNLRADTGKKVAETNKVDEETKGTAIENQYKEESIKLYQESIKVQNSLNRGQLQKIDLEVNQIDADISLKIKQAETEEQRKELIASQNILARMNARQIAAMLPYQQAYMSAQTEAARQAAALSATEALYKQGVIDSGYIDYMADEVYGKSRSAQAKADVDELKAGFRTGNFGESSPVAKWYQSDNKIATRIVNTAVNILDNLNPIANLFVGAFGN